MPFTVVKVLHFLFCLTNHEREKLCALSQSLSQSVSLRPTTKHYTTHPLPYASFLKHSFQSQCQGIFFIKHSYNTRNPFLLFKIFDLLWQAAISSPEWVWVFFSCSFKESNFLRHETPAVELTRAVLLSPVKNQPQSVAIIFILRRDEFWRFLCWTRRLYTFSDTRGAAG